MKKSYLSLLTVAIVIASTIIGGCMTSNQANQASTSGTSTNTSTTTSAITKAATTSATVKPSSSALPTATPAPSASEKIATSIQFARDPNVVKGTAIGINV